MKNKSIITMLILCMGLGMATTSCNDMLSPDSDRHSYTVAQDTLYSYWGILKSLQNVAERYVILGECRGDLVDGTNEFVTDSIKAILEFGLNGTSELQKDGSCRYLQVSDYYHIINSCNAYIAKCDTWRKTGSGEYYMIKEYVQVQAIRAWVYLQLVTHYGKVPFYLDPMLTTKEIENFDATTNFVTADNLWEKLEEELTPLPEWEHTEGYPQYDKYGYASTVCHSSKAMFPIDIVMGDIYLIGNQYEKAAQSYYDFFRYSEFGGIIPNDYFSFGWLKTGDTESFGGESMFGSSNLTYTGMGTPYTETGKVSKSTESITCIPSSTNKLWGTVLRGVNDLFGFKSEISVNTDTASTTAYVSLTQNWERQLGASTGYWNLTAAQPYEVYIGADINTAKKEGPKVVPGMRDARARWIRNYSGNYNDVKRNDMYVMKQNPGGAFTTVYPMIYRKSTVWLRFAEALNRAGYPSYAFAILKHGLCSTTGWVPTSESQITQYPAKTSHVEATEIVEATGESIVYEVDLQYDPEQNVKNQEDVSAFMKDVCVLDPETGEIVIDASGNPTLREGVTMSEEITAYYNFPIQNAFICDYINLKEFKNAIGKDYLNFNRSEFDGESSQYIQLQKTWSDERTTLTIQAMSSGDLITRGIHSRGCGLLAVDEPNSVYNFVGQIAEKSKQYNNGVALTKEQIYDGEHDEMVQKCVEDLILDEEGLELAFEGTRFFDLLRVARHRGDDTFIGKKIAERNPSASWATSLKGGGASNTGNVYLPLPDNSNR